MFLAFYCASSEMWWLRIGSRRVGPFTMTGFSENAASSFYEAVFFSLKMYSLKPNLFKNAPNGGFDLVSFFKRFLAYIRLKAETDIGNTITIWSADWDIDAGN